MTHGTKSSQSWLTPTKTDQFRDLFCHTTAQHPRQSPVNIHRTNPTWRTSHRFSAKPQASTFLKYTYIHQRYFNNAISLVLAATR